MTPGASRRAFVVHDAAHVAAALTAAAEAGAPVTLLSAPGAAAYLGAAGFRAMVLDTAAAFPSVDLLYVLDCGDSPGLAMNALRHGLPAIRFEAPGPLRAKIADMAAQVGARLDTGGGPALDLLDEADPLAACRRWLRQAAESLPSGSAETN